MRAVVLAIAAILATAAPASACLWADKYQCERAKFRSEAVDALLELQRQEREFARPMPDANETLRRQAAWVERCKPTIEPDATGQPRRVYAMPGCERGP